MGGIYGGRLPSWWKDLEAEKEQTSVETSKDGADASKKAPDSIAVTVTCDVAKIAPPRLKCRYGAECRRKNEDHFKVYAHPGDDDWSTDAAVENKASESAAPACEDEVDGEYWGPPATAEVQRRTCCRYGASCCRNGAEHRKAFAHPGDADWTDKADDNASLAESKDSADCR